MIVDPFHGWFVAANPTAALHCPDHVRRAPGRETERQAV